jgi:S-formylglutathione hydrolase FrmB
MHKTLLSLVLLATAAIPAGSQTSPVAPAPARLRIDRDLEYAQAGGHSLKLDLYTREGRAEPAPIVVWIHGAGGDKSPCPAAGLVADGYAVASIEYRNEKPLADGKAAIRWLRANAQKHNLDGAHIGVWGFSMGGRLAAMLGTSGDVKELEGDEGNAGQSSRVQAVVDFAGPTDGKSKESDPAAWASPDDPPFLVVQGSADIAVQPQQSERFVNALKHGGVDAWLEEVIGAGHNVAQLRTGFIADSVTNFFDKNLRNGNSIRENLSSFAQPADCWEDSFTDEIGGVAYRTYPTPARGPNTKASYRIYLPPDYETAKDRRYPVIYWLHGANGDSRQAIAHGYIGRLDAGIRNGSVPAVIVVMTNVPNLSSYVDSKDGAIPVETVLVKNLIPYIDSKYRTVATRQGRAIEGQSMGGAGALRIGFTYPELFAAVSATAPGLPDLSRLDSMPADRLKIMYGGDLDYFKACAAQTLVKQNADKIRGRTNIRLIVGDKDALMPRVQEFHELLTKLDIQHDFYISKGSIHNLREELSRCDANPFEVYARAFASFK